MNGVDEQLKRRPNQFPKLKVKNGINAQFEDLELIGYDPQEQIKFPLS
jgi:thymidylate synthase